MLMFIQYTESVPDVLTLVRSDTAPIVEDPIKQIWVDDTTETEGMQVIDGKLVSIS